MAIFFKEIFKLATFIFEIILYYSQKKLISFYLI